MNTGNDLNGDFEVYVNETVTAHDADCLQCEENQPDILNHNIQLNEVESVLADLSNNKSPGLDGITYEFIKNAPNRIISAICSLYNLILHTGDFPKQWCDAIITPIHKKGSKSEVKNYRGISLLCIMGKIFTKVLNNRLTRWADINGKIDESQGAYRTGRSTADHIFSLHAMIQRYLSKRGGRFYVAFIDFSCAFDSVPHTHLWYRLLQDGIHGRIITVIRSLYSCLRSCVKVPEGLTEFFRCTVGTRQGCMISPYLFSLYVNELVRLLDELGCPGMRIDEAFSNVNLLMYADDIALMNDTIGRLQNSIDILSTFCDKYGLKVNMSKTNVIIFRNGGPIRHNEHVFYRGDPILCVTYYKYLGMMFSSRLCWTVALQTLASQADKAIFKIKNTIKTCGGIPITLALDLFDKIVLPILIYGAEIWGTKYAGPIEAVHIKYCKYILRVSSSTSNAAVMGELGRYPLYIHYFCRCVKFWFNIIHNNASEPRLRTSMYNNLKRLDDNGRHTWATEIRYLLYRYGFGHVWLNQGVEDIPLFLELFKQRLLDTSLQNWHSDVMDNRKLETYSTYKIDFCLETYLTIDMYHKHRIEYTRFRCSSHNLAIEKLRPTHDRVDRVCKYTEAHRYTPVQII